MSVLHSENFFIRAIFVIRAPHNSDIEIFTTFAKTRMILYIIQIGEKYK